MTRSRLRILPTILALVAIALGIAAMGWKRVSYRQSLTVQHARLAEDYKHQQKVFLMGVSDLETPEMERLRRLAMYHERLASKYRELASRPWLSVEPDPPPPE